MLLAVAAAGIIAVYALAWWLVSRGHAVLSRFGSRLEVSSAEAPGRPLHDWLAGRFPRLYPAVAARFDPRHFRGLPLTLIVVAAGYLAVLFFGLIEEVMESDEIDTLDDFVVAMVAPLRNPVLVKLFTGLTHFGDTATLAAVAIVATGFLWARGPAWGIPSVWIAIAGSQVTTWTGKFLIDRPRPDFVLDVGAWSPSFPSGHATGAMAVYGILAYVIARDLPSYRRRFDMTFGTALLILAIAFSRVYLSVHHPSDVAAGLLVGGFWLLAGIAVAELLRPHPAAAGR
jgi:membrane-associated phospholipid phosphatase